MNAPDGTHVVREPEGPERRACRMLLPESEATIGWTQRLVAVERSSGAVLGAAMAMPLRHHDGEVHARFIMHVARPFRGRGIGSAILAALSERARMAGEQALVGIAGDRGAVTFLERAGFTLQQRVICWEVDASACGGRIATLADRAMRTGRVPAGMRVEALTAAAIPRLAALHAELIGGAAHVLAIRMHEMLADPAWAHSRMLSVDGVPHAFFAMRTMGAATGVPFLFVSPHLQAARGSIGGTTLRLFASMLEAIQGSPVERCEFDCLERNGPMMALAARFGARRTAAREMLIRPVA